MNNKSQLKMHSISLRFFSKIKTDKCVFIKAEYDKLGEKSYKNLCVVFSATFV